MYFPYFYPVIVQFLFNAIFLSAVLNALAPQFPVIFMFAAVVAERSTKFVNISTNVYNNDGRVKVRVTEGHFNSEVVLLEFMVPASCLKSVGKSLWVPKEILQARCKHDGKFTFDHYSGGTI
jgi:hypothetical protein